MFDEPTSLPMHAAIASLLGGLFGVAMILVTQVAQAQTVEPAAAAASVDAGAVIRRIGDATLRGLSNAEPRFGWSSPGARGMRLQGSDGEVGSGLRWQVARGHGLRSEGEIPRSRDLLSVGVQVRF
jgi:hypothetical protein